MLLSHHPLVTATSHHPRITATSHHPRITATSHRSRISSFLILQWSERTCSSCQTLPRDAAQSSPALCSSPCFGLSRSAAALAAISAGHAQTDLLVLLGRKDNGIAVLSSRASCLVPRVWRGHAHRTSLLASFLLKNLFLSLSTDWFPSRH